MYLPFRYEDSSRVENGCFCGADLEIFIFAYENGLILVRFEYDSDKKLPYS